MAKKKVFLSLPMKDHDNEWISNEIESMKKHLADGEEAVVNYCSLLSSEPSRLYNLGEAIKKLGDCDAILMHPLWRNAHGCNVEWTVAKEYGIPVRYIV